LSQHLHIVCLDVPYPPDYGGVFDLFYKLKALKNAGVLIHLHCFEYGRSEQEALNEYCVSVHYYKRFEGHKGLSATIPYIVSSRSNIELLTNLEQDDYPILLEGIHCTYFLHQGKLDHRKVFIRLHNVEYEYYHHLYATTPSLFRKAYYFNESRLLKRYERAIANKAMILAVSEEDVHTYRREFAARDITYLPVFVPFTEVTSPEGMGSYCLYHGNLSVPENEKAAIWLLKHVFNDVKVNFVIAGKNPSALLERLAHKHDHTCLVANPDEREMKELIAKAQINVLPSFNATGVKLKLLNAICNGRHCVVNEAAVMGSGLESACHIGTSVEAIRQIIIQLYHQPFTEDEIVLRKNLFAHRYDNAVNAEKLRQLIW
jgi:glycosyltransferase involved in cell wall biosynthesis